MSITSGRTHTAWLYIKLPTAQRWCILLLLKRHTQSIRSVPDSVGHSHHLTALPSHLCMMAGWQVLTPVTCTDEDW
jgi:hypothetical protein